LTKSVEKAKVDCVFRIKHTANIVEYNILDFPTKNMDKIEEAMEECMLQTTNPEFKSFFNVFNDIEIMKMEEEGASA
jgi:myosin heavy subunit